MEAVRSERPAARHKTTDFPHLRPSLRRSRRERLSWICVFDGRGFRRCHLAWKLSDRSAPQPVIKRPISPIFGLPFGALGESASPGFASLTDEDSDAATWHGSCLRLWSGVMFLKDLEIAMRLVHFPRASGPESVSNREHRVSLGAVVE